jgi:hypothetical protein
MIEDHVLGERVKLMARVPGSPDAPLSEARSVTMRGTGYSSEDDAVAAGQVWRSRLMRSFAAVGVGADFGARAPHGHISPAGLAAFGPPDKRTLNGVHGLMVFECDPDPVFIGVNPVTAMVSSPHQRLIDAMAEAIATGGLSEDRQVSYDLSPLRSVSLRQMLDLRCC